MERKDFKFSLENWKIIDEVKEESRRLKLLDMTEVHQDLLIKNEHVPSHIVNKQSNISQYCSVDEIKRHDDEPSVNHNSRECPSKKDCCSDDTEEPELPILQPNNSLPSPLQTVMNCLFNIEKFKKYFVGISRICPDPDTFSCYPTIHFFVKAVQSINPSEAFHHSFLSQDLSSSIIEESPGELFKSTIEILHEELVQARREKILKFVCDEDCRTMKRNNHTIVSHLFKGFMHREMVCRCKHVMKEQEMFTTITIPLEDMVEKEIMVLFAGENKNMVYHMTRLLLLITSWTTFGSLKEKLSRILQQKGLHVPVRLMSAHIIKNGCVNAPLNDHINMFSSINDYDSIWVFNTAVGDHFIGWHSFSSINPNVSFDKMQMAYSSTPALSQSSLSQNILDLTKHKYSTEQKRCTALVFVECVCFHSSTNTTIVIRLPRISNCLHVMERIARIFSLTHREIQSITFKNKTGHCLYCLSKCCSGCPFEVNKKISLNHQYTVTVIIKHERSENFVPMCDDSSVTNNKPIKILSVEECINGFLERKGDVVCPSCTEKEWISSESVILKWPKILILHLPMFEIKHYVSFCPNIWLSPKQSQSISNSTYSLLNMVTNEDDYSTFTEGWHSREWVVHPHNEEEVNSMVDKPMNQVELLIYRKIKDIGLKTEPTFREPLLSKKFFVTKGLTRSRFGCDLIENAKDLSEQFSRVSSLRSEQESLCTCTHCDTLKEIHVKILKSKESISSVTSSEHCFNEKCQSDLDRCCGSGKNIYLRLPSKRRWQDNVSSESFAQEVRLHETIRNQDLKQFVKCLEGGADVNHLHKGYAPLHLTVGMEEPFARIFTKLCLENGGNANLFSFEELTPVHLAVKLDRVDILRALLDHGGLPHVKNIYGKDAFDFMSNGKRGNCEEIFHLLKRMEPQVVNRERLDGDDDESSESSTKEQIDQMTCSGEYDEKSVGKKYISMIEDFPAITYTMSDTEDELEPIRNRWFSLSTFFKRANKCRKRRFTSARQRISKFVARISRYF